ncbi:amino acid permease [Lacrimispora xylanisolvens]|uniref:amino acid permease n=1 Tax=Lacrimispora xylanisolvens TaxID=384636 RepID=UPI002402A497
MKKKLNVFTVSGLMTGPILGSGIIFLPSLAYDMLGEHAIFAWIIIMALNILFAYVFAKMTIIASDNRGISTIVGDMFGSRFGTLAANYLTVAVFFGPVAVAITAAEFIGPAVTSVFHVSPWVTAGGVLFYLCHDCYIRCFLYGKIYAGIIQYHSLPAACWKRCDSVSFTRSVDSPQPAGTGDPGADPASYILGDCGLGDTGKLCGGCGKSKTYHDACHGDKSDSNYFSISADCFRISKQSQSFHA